MTHLRHLNGLRESLGPLLQLSSTYRYRPQKLLILFLCTFHRTHHLWCKILIGQVESTTMSLVSTQGQNIPAWKASRMKHQQGHRKKGRIC